MENEELTLDQTTTPIDHGSYNAKYVPKKEFWWFAIGGLGQGMIYAAMSSYISDFYISVMKVTPLFVMLLMLLARVWDAINDPLMGMLADKTNSRWGKFRPYLLVTPIPVAILTFLMFYAPGFTRLGAANYSETKTYVYVAVVYVLWGMIYTMSDVPYWSLPNAMTPNTKERANVISFGRTLNGIGSAVPMVIIIVSGYLADSLQLDDYAKYTIMAMICAIGGNALFTTVFFKTKERVTLPRPVKRDKSQPSALKLIFTCKPLMLVVAMGVLSSARYMLQGAAIHVARYAFYIDGMTVESSRSTVQLVFSISTAIGMFGSMLLMPKAFKRWNYKQIVIGTCLIGFVFGMITFFIGYQNIYVLVPFIIISSIPLGAINIVSYAMIGDALDFMEWKTGRREMGLGSACQSFVNKLGNALATTFIIAMYLILGFSVSEMADTSGGVIDPSTLDHSIRNGMFMLVSLIPAVSLLLCTIPLFFYKLDTKTMEKISDELKAQREEKGIEIQVD